MMFSKLSVLGLLALALMLTTWQPAQAGKKALLVPSQLDEQAPDVYKVKFETTKGPFFVQVRRQWAPQGADRFYNLVKNGFYNDVYIFRVVHGFVAQFGISGDPEISKVWSQSRIKDDPVEIGNKRGTITFATAGKDSRTTQVFINYTDNARLDKLGFAPFGEVVEGMDEVVDSLFGGYGEKITRLQGKIVSMGNSYLKENFPKLDHIKKATIVE
jgi:peptidyl-prolyl cis-trans isomerase A (cyclophilin A)